MASEPSVSAGQSSPLHCSHCGNTTYFIEVMEHVENLVDARLHHVHLLVGIPDRYYCRECGELVEVWKS